MAVRARATILRSSRAALTFLFLLPAEPKRKARNSSRVSFAILASSSLERPLYGVFLDMLVGAGYDFGLQRQLLGGGHERFDRDIVCDAVHLKKHAAGP